MEVVKTELFILHLRNQSNKPNDVARLCASLARLVDRLQSISRCRRSGVSGKESAPAKITRSRMMGAASRESSQVLCITIVCLPPMKISAEYSSMARLLSAT